MKNPFHRKTVSRAISEFAQSLERDLMDSNSELRQLFARVARSEAKNFFALHLGTELEKFERELAARAERVLAELGSAVPTLDQHVTSLPGLTCVKCSQSIREHISPAGEILCPNEAELGSAAPSLDQHAEDALRVTSDG